MTSFEAQWGVVIPNPPPPPPPPPWLPTPLMPSLDALSTRFLGAESQPKLVVYAR